MQVMMIMFCTGAVVMLAGVLLLAREDRLFANAFPAKAAILSYDEYIGVNSGIPMYTMAGEYRLPDGSLIHARGQDSSNRKKYSPGDPIAVAYNREKPERFTVQGDRLRRIAMHGMIASGLMLSVLSGYMLAS